MPLKLSDIDNKIGDVRRSIQSLVDKKGEAFQAYDALTVEVDALQAVSEPTDAQVADLKAKTDSAKAKRTEINALADQIRDQEAKLHDLQADREIRIEHNKQEASMREPGSRVTSGAEDPKGSEGSHVRVLPPSKEALQRDVADIFRCLFLAKTQGGTVRQAASGQLDSNFRNDRLEAAFTQSSNTSVIPDGYRPTLIEMLRPGTVVRQMAGLRQVPMPNGTFREPRQLTASTANYVGEAASIPTSQPTTDGINMVAKKLTCMVPVTGEALRHSNPSMDAMIRQDMQNSVNEKEDATFLRATRSSTVPGGLKWFADQAAATQVIAANATVNLDNVTKDLGKLKRALRTVNTPNRNRYFIMSPRSEQYLMDLRDGNGNYAFPEMERGILRNTPFLVTTQIPENLGVGTDKSEILYVEASEMYIGDTMTMDLQLSLEAAYNEGSGLVSAFQTDTAVFRLILEHDTGLRHPTSVAYLSGVNWGV
jgi:HK97 family phage major capsid protein